MWNKPSKKELRKVPRLYETENISLDEKIITHHFFINACSWFLAEYDGKDLCFGYVILNGDLQNAEWGYFSMLELESISVLGVEIINNPHWKTCKFCEIATRL